VLQPPKAKDFKIRNVRERQEEADPVGSKAARRCGLDSTISWTPSSPRITGGDGARKVCDLKLEALSLMTDAWFSSDGAAVLINAMRRKIFNSINQIYPRFIGSNMTLEET
jgi:hypothetical protein